MARHTLNQGPRHRLARAGFAVAAVMAGLAPVVGVGIGVGLPAASAALSTAGGACGFHLGAPFETGAMQTLGFEVPVYPANPHQVCAVSVTAAASLAPTAGGHYTNVSGDPSTQTVTLDFTGGPNPLGLLWVWTPHCADPAAPGTFTAAIDGQSSSTPVGAESCSPDLGGHSSLSFRGVDPSDGEIMVGVSGTMDSRGYVAVSGTGVVLTRGDAVHAGDTPLLNQPAVGVAADPVGPGYWVVTSDGGVFAFGGAGFHGSLGSIHLNAPIVGMAATPDGGGYWLVAADGGVFAFGDAGFHGSLGSIHLNAPIVGMAATHSGGGYWLAAADGGVFAFGDAPFHGSLGSIHLNAPVVGVAATPTGGGYWLAAYDGGVFAFGTAPFRGSAGSLPLGAPVFSISGTRTGNGYWLLAGDGGIFAYGDAGFFGSTPFEP